MKNDVIASHFELLADLLEIQGANPFRIRAYRNGARAIRDLDEPVAIILLDSTRRLADLPGIGGTLAEKAQTLVETGALPQLVTLRQEFPEIILTMTRIPGLGAKKAAALHRELGISTLDDLRTACEAGRVRVLKGFGKKTEETILAGLSFAETTEQRILWIDAEAIVYSLTKYFSTCDAIQQLEFAGSYRRKRETIGDLDLLVASERPNQVMDHFEQFADRSETLVRGDTKMSIRVFKGTQIDLRVVRMHQFGAALQYFTGSQAHNVHVRQLAKKAGLRINEYGVFRDGTDQPIAGATEEEVYRAIDLPWFSPELREDRQEFAFALAGPLPKLIQLSDLQGDLHMHTTATDGSASVEEMAEAAIARGLKYIAITDHSKRVSMARGLDADRALAQWRMIDRVREQFADRIGILKGIECDILEAGGMDLPDEVLAQADWVVASVHYGQKQTREQITARILGAIRNPHVDCIAHPTGRLINRRPAYEVDLEAVLQACAETGTLIELNANPMRLDLDDTNCSSARRHGVLVVINSDAHSPDGLGVLQYGINQARRAGLTAADVANSRPWQEFGHC